MNLEEKIEYLRARGEFRRSNRRWYKKWWGVLILIFAYIIIIFSVASLFLIFRVLTNQEFRDSYLFSQKSLELGQEKQLQDEKTREMMLSIVEGNDTPYIGNKDAEISIVVFSDFNCPYCKKASEVIASLSVKYGQKIKIISRDFAVLNDNSLVLATAALCAGEQGKYWPMYYKLFELQGQFDLDNLASLARMAGINDLKSFSDCLNGDKYYNFIVQAVVDGQFLEIKGTPAWFINGEKIHEGLIPFEMFSGFLDEVILNKNL